MMRLSAPKPKFSAGKLHEVCGSLFRVPRLEKIQILEWLLANIQLFDTNILKVHYGFLLNFLRKSMPVKPLVNILVVITDASTVTQSRVNFVCDFYSSKMNSPSVGRLLQVMAKRCKAHIFVPPVGQISVEYSHIPLDTRLLLSYDKNDPSCPETRDLPASRVCTKMYQALMGKASDSEFAEGIVQLVPLVEQTGRIPAALEKMVYSYFLKHWGRKFKYGKTIVLTVVASSFFRFWPLDNELVVKENLLDPLLAANKSAAEVLIPNLWHFGALAQPLMDTFVKYYRPSELEWFRPLTPTMFAQIFQYYSNLDSAVPPAIFVANLVTRLHIYLFPCSQWSHLVPAVGLTLQGEFCLVSSDDSIEIIDMIFDGHQNVETLFALANSPWLGGYPQRTFSRVKAHLNVSVAPLLSSQRPASSVVIVRPETLESDVGISYPEFCQQLVKDLQNAGLSIVPYLRDNAK